MDDTAEEDIKKFGNSEVELVKPAVKEEAEHERGQGDIARKDQEKKLSHKYENMEVRGGAEVVVDGGDRGQEKRGRRGSRDHTAAQGAGDISSKVLSEDPEASRTPCVDSSCLSWLVLFTDHGNSCLLEQGELVAGLEQVPEGGTVDGGRRWCGGRRWWRP